jgi:hypothetical protein
MSTPAIAPVRDRATQELHDAQDRLINALAKKTRTIAMLQQQMDVLFECVDVFCEHVEARRFDELADLVARYKQLIPSNRSIN